MCQPDAPTSPTTPPAPSYRPRVTTETDAGERRRGRWLVLGLVLVLALPVTGTALAQRYEPLQRGSFSGDGDGQRTTDPQTGEDVVALPFRPGAEVSVLVSIRNSGRFAVTVDGVRPDDPGAYFRLESATAVPVEGATPLQGRLDLPFHLQPGMQVGLRLTYRLPRCGFAPGSASVADTVPVRWHAFRSNHVTLLPQTPVTFAVPAGDTGPVTRPC